MNRGKFLFVSLLLLGAWGCSQPGTVTLEKDVLMDKIKGGWA